MTFREFYCIRRNDPAGMKIAKLILWACVLGCALLIGALVVLT